MRSALTPYLVEKTNEMLQFDKSLTTNSNAVWPDISASAGTNLLILEFTQSYDYSKTGMITASLLSAISPSNPWLVFQVSGSQVPSPTGQYNVEIYAATQVPNGLTWGTQNTLWAQTAITWAGVTVTKQNLLSTERAFVSGSNEYTITEYLLPTNGGTYTTYNHP